MTMMLANDVTVGRVLCEADGFEWTVIRVKSAGRSMVELTLEPHEAAMCVVKPQLRLTTRLRRTTRVRVVA